MTIEQIVAVAARLRRLSEAEFDTLVRLIRDGDVAAEDDEASVAAACDALADAAAMFRDDRLPTAVPMRARPTPHAQGARRRDG